MQTDTDTTIRTFETGAFGRETRFEYAALWVGYALVSMRLVMGWVLLQGGLTKLVTYLDANPANDWTAAEFLLHAIPDGNPLAGPLADMAGNPLVDGLVMWGVTLTGFGDVIGAFVRWNAFWGAAMMIFFWAASLTGGIAAGLPVAHGWVVDDHLIYAVLLFGLGAAGAGRILCLAARLETVEFVRKNRWLRPLLG